MWLCQSYITFFQYDSYLLCLSRSFVSPLTFLMPFLAWILHTCFHREGILSILWTIVGFWFLFREVFKAGCSLFPFLNKLHLVLSFFKCIDSLSSINHLQRLLKPTFRCSWIELKFLLLKRMHVSSAYDLKSQSIGVDFMSFTYNKKV